MDFIYTTLKLILFVATNTKWFLRELFLFASPPPLPQQPLKVDGNEKRGGSGRT
jgi:hypothetical protein